MNLWDDDFQDFIGSDFCGSDFSSSDPGSQNDPYGCDPMREADIYNSLQSSRARDDLFGISSGRGILGDMAADQQLAHDIASGMNVRDALERQRGLDYIMGDRRSNDILSDMLTDDLIARDVENGKDIGEAVAKEEFWGNFFDDLFNS